MIKQPMSTTAAKALGEVVACTLMMGSGLKNEESLQVNLVGKDGIRNVMAITDSGKSLSTSITQFLSSLASSSSLSLCTFTHY